MKFGRQGHSKSFEKFLNLEISVTVKFRVDHNILAFESINNASYFISSISMVRESVLTLCFIDLNSYLYRSLAQFNVWPEIFGWRGVLGSRRRPDHSYVPDFGRCQTKRISTWLNAAFILSGRKLKFFDRIFGVTRKQNLVYVRKRLLSNYWLEKIIQFFNRASTSGLNPKYPERSLLEVSASSNLFSFRK